MLRRSTLAVIIAVVALAPPALASNEGPDHIVGTGGNDYLMGGSGPDRIEGLAGDDRIWGQRAPDVLLGGSGDDALHGFGSGNAPDVLNGGPGDDRCVGTKHDVFRSCEEIVVRKGLGPRP